MKSPEDVRKVAAEQGKSDATALQMGREEGSREFVDQGNEIYAQA